MPDLTFDVTGVEPAARGVTPLLHFDLAIRNVPATETVQSVMLQTQIRLEATQRSYNEREREKLVELFGAPEDWGRALGDRHWTQVDVAVPTFSEGAEVTLPVQCTFDLNIASAKYLYALEAGDVPLRFLFSGTVFYATSEGRMQVQPISRNEEATYRMPVAVWKEMIETYYPGSAWMYVDRDVFERLYAYRRRNGLPSWEATFDDLLPEREETPGDEETEPAGTDNGLHRA